MDNRIICMEEQIKTNFLSLEMEPDCSEYCVSIDGEVIIWSNDVEDANDYYKTVKANILNYKYVKEGLPV